MFTEIAIKYGSNKNCINVISHGFHDPCLFTVINESMVFSGHKTMATATATMESSQTLIQSESRVQRSYQEVQITEQRQVKKKSKSSRRHKEEGSISVVSIVKYIHLIILHL